MSLLETMALQQHQAPQSQNQQLEQPEQQEERRHRAAGNEPSSPSPAKPATVESLLYGADAKFQVLLAEANVMSLIDVRERVCHGSC